MLSFTSYEQFKSLAQLSSRVVVSQEIYADILTPIRVFQVLASGQPEAVLLDSSEYKTSQDACIYIGLNPLSEFTLNQKGITVKNKGGICRLTGDPFVLLRDFYHQHKSVSEPTLSKFSGGMIGLMSYDAIRLIEDIPNRHQYHDPDEIPLMNFKFYGTHIVFDKRTGKVLVSQVIDLEGDVKACYQQACDANAMLIKKMFHSSVHSVYQTNNPLKDPFDNVTIDSSDDEFKMTVAKAKKYIQSGDIFQVVLSRSFKRPFKGNDFDIYRALRVLNPSPYQFYIRHSDYTVIGSSPEKLVSLQQQVIESCPIAGTRPRASDFDRDQALEQELLQDEKEISEHMMLVDLSRNDVGSVSEIGSVSVTELQKIKRFSSVMHMSSTVCGKLARDKDAFDVLKAAFPAGTLSGAPKIRAMEIIDELESSQRQLYGGAVVAIDDQGQLDSCIVIRTVVTKNKIATIRAGAGIVLDSDPQSEANETRHKVTGVLSAITLAEAGLR